MVTKPNKPNPPGPTGLRPHPSKIEPPTRVSGGPTIRDPGDDVANKDRTKDNKFVLPDKVSAADIKSESFRYGGGRSAGNRSLADNMIKKVVEP